MWTVADEECAQAEYTGIALEYGTVPVMEVLDALRADVAGEPPEAGAAQRRGRSSSACWRFSTPTPRPGSRPCSRRASRRRRRRGWFARRLKSKRCVWRRRRSRRGPRRAHTSQPRRLYALLAPRSRRRTRYVFTSFAALGDSSNDAREYARRPGTALLGDSQILPGPFAALNQQWPASRWHATVGSAAPSGACGAPMRRRAAQSSRPARVLARFVLCSPRLSEAASGARGISSAAGQDEQRRQSAPADRYRSAAGGLLGAAPQLGARRRNAPNDRTPSGVSPSAIRSGRRPASRRSRPALRASFQASHLARPTMSVKPGALTCPRHRRWPAL